MTEKEYPLNFYQAIEAAMGGAVIERYDSSIFSLNHATETLRWSLDLTSVGLTLSNTRAKYRIHTPAPKPKVKRAHYEFMRLEPDGHRFPVVTDGLFKDDEDFIRSYGHHKHYKRLTQTEREYDE